MRIFLFIVVGIIAHSGFAQDARLAKSEYYKAEEAYNIGDYNKCINHLISAENSSSPNNLTTYLKTKALVGLEQYVEAEIAINQFFEVTPKSYSREYKYQEMVSLHATIKVNAEKFRQREKLDWTTACNANDPKIIYDFLKQYPYSSYSSEKTKIFNQIETNYFSKIKRYNKKPDYETYLYYYPAGRYTIEANKEISNIIKNENALKLKQNQLAKLEDKNESIRYKRKTALGMLLLGGLVGGLSQASADGGKFSIILGYGVAGISLASIVITTYKLAENKRQIKKIQLN